MNNPDGSAHRADLIGTDRFCFAFCADCDWTGPAYEPTPADGIEVPPYWQQASFDADLHMEETAAHA